MFSSISGLCRIFKYSQSFENLGKSIILTISIKFPKRRSSRVCGSDSFSRSPLHKKNMSMSEKLNNESWNERVRRLEKKGNNGWLVGKVAKLEKRLVELERQVEQIVHQLQLHLSTPDYLKADQEYGPYADSAISDPSPTWTEELEDDGAPYNEDSTNIVDPQMIVPTSGGNT